MMHLLLQELQGQHVYLFTASAVEFYKKLGFQEGPVGMEIVVGRWLHNNDEG